MLKWLIAAVLILYRGLRPNGGVRQVCPGEAQTLLPIRARVLVRRPAPPRRSWSCAGIHADDLVYRHAASNCGEQRGVRSYRADVGLVRSTALMSGSLLVPPSTVRPLLRSDAHGSAGSRSEASSEELFVKGGWRDQPPQLLGAALLAT